jgi:hypothetical protein
MEVKEMKPKAGKPFIIANPIYDTVFKRLMENKRIAKFFISTILEQQVDDITVLPQEFTYQLDSTRISEKSDDKNGGAKGYIEHYFVFRLDFMATVRDADGVRRKILIELQKSWDTTDVMRFRRYLGEQYIRVDNIDGKDTILPITTIYILGNNLVGIDCPCLKAGRTYIDMMNNEPVDAKSEFVENLTHDSYVIQASRIKDVRYTTNLDKLLSIFEQKYFIVEDSGARKEYPYQPDDENIQLITDILYEMGADPKKRKEIEAEEEALRVYNLQHEMLVQKLEENKKELKDNAKKLKDNEKKLKNNEKKLKDKDEKLKDKDKKLKDKDKRIAELERLLRDKQVEL